MLISWTLGTTTLRLQTVWFDSTYPAVLSRRRAGIFVKLCWYFLGRFITIKTSGRVSLVRAIRPFDVVHRSGRRSNRKHGQFGRVHREGRSRSIHVKSC